MRLLEHKGWIRPQRKGFKWCCCRCGVVHQIDFRLKKIGKRNSIQLRTRFDPRSTGQVVRWMK